MKASYVFAAILMVCICVLAFADGESRSEAGRYELTLTSDGPILFDTATGTVYENTYMDNWMKKIEFR